ncbi:MAG: DUF342 domain-containing protein [Phycisphaerae bacterium]|nr:DUF342 domain-containing protein [Phycisphaerae bacterium]
MKIILTPDKLLKLQVNDDATEAILAVNDEHKTSSLTLSDLLNYLKAFKVCYAQDKIGSILAPFISSIANNQKPEPVIVAIGLPPKHDTPGKIVKLFEQNDEPEQSAQQDDQKSHYDNSDIITTKKDDPLVRLEQPITGCDGTNIFGQPIPRKLGKEVKIKLGANVRQQGDTIYSEVDGKVDFNSNLIRVEKILEIGCDVDFSVGNIDFDGDVEIHKNILDLFKVQVSGNLTVHGIIEAADISVGNDLLALGGISAKEKGHIKCAGNLQCKYLTNSEIEVGGKIDASGEIINCTINCNGQLTTKTSEVSGGTYNIKGGLVCKDLGAESEVKTLVEIGYDRQLEEDAKTMIPQIRTFQKKSEKVRMTVEPLLANAKQLNNAQKEKATELLYNTYELDEKSDDLYNKLKEGHDSAEKTCVQEVLVLDKLYPGVTIQFPRVQTTIKRQIDGPVRIVPERLRKNSYRVVAIFQGSDKVVPLPSRLSTEECWEQLDDLLKEFEPEPVSAK